MISPLTTSLFISLHFIDDGRLSEVWAIALSNDGSYLAGTTHDGHLKVWDLRNGCEEVRNFETKGSFGMCIDMVGTVYSDLNLCVANLISRQMGIW